MPNPLDDWLNGSDGTSYTPSNNGSSGSSLDDYLNAPDGGGGGGVLGNYTTAPLKDAAGLGKAGGAVGAPFPVDSPFAQNTGTTNTTVSQYPQTTPQNMPQPPQHVDTPIADAMRQGHISNNNNLLAAGGAVLNDVGNALGQFGAKTTGEEVTAAPVRNFLQSLPGVGIGEIALEALGGKDVQNAMDTPLRDVPVLGGAVRGAETVANALGATNRVISMPATGAIVNAAQPLANAINKAETDNPWLKNAVDFAPGMTSVGAQALQFFAKPVDYSKIGATPDEINKLTGDFMNGKLDANGVARFETLTKKVADQYSSNNPAQGLVLQAATDPLTYADAAGAFEYIGRLQQIRREWEAALPLAKVGEEVAKQPLIDRIILSTISRPLQAEEGAWVGEKALGLTSDSLGARIVKPFSLTNDAKATETLKSSADNVGAWLSDTTRNLGDKLEWFSNMRRAVETKSTEPLKAMFGEKIADSPNFRRAVYGAMNFEPPKDILQNYGEAQKIFKQLDDTLLLKNPVYDPAHAGFIRTQAEGLGQDYGNLFNRVMDEWQNGKIDLNTARQQVEKVASAQLLNAYIEHAAGVYTKMFGVSEPNLITKFVNRMKAYEGLFYVNNPATIAVNLLNTGATSTRNGISVAQTAEEMAAYWDRFGYTPRASMGDEISKALKDGLQQQTAFGATTPGWTSKVPGFKQLRQFNQFMENRSRAQVLTQGVERFMNHNFTPPALPPDLAAFYRTLGGNDEVARVMKELQQARSAQEAERALLKGYKSLASYLEDIAPDIAKDLKTASGQDIALTGEMLRDALPIETRGKVAKILEQTYNRAAKGEDAVTAYRSERYNMNVRTAEDANPLFPEANAQAQPSTTASTKVMITKADEAQLRALGYSQADINAMRPNEAGDILANGTRKAAPAPTGATNQPPPRQAQAPTMKPVENMPQGGVFKDVPPEAPAAAVAETPPTPPTAPGEPVAIENTVTENAPTGISLDAIKQRAAQMTTPQVDAGFARQLKAIAENDPVRLAKVPAINANAPMESVTELLDVARKQGQKWVDALPELYQLRAQWVYQHADLYRYPEEEILQSENYIRALTNGERGLNFDELANPTTRDGSNIGEWLKQWYADRGEQFPRPVKRRAGSLAERTDQLASEQFAKSRGGASVAAGKGEAVGGERPASPPTGETNPVADVAQQAETTAREEIQRVNQAGGKLQLRKAKNPDKGEWLLVGRDESGHSLSIQGDDAFIAKTLREYHPTNAADAYARNADAFNQHWSSAPQRYQNALDAAKAKGGASVLDENINAQAHSALEDMILNALEKHLDPAAMKQANVLTPELEQLARQYLKADFMPELNTAKQGAVASARTLLGQTVLNYDGRYNIDDMLQLAAPFSFWWLHTLGNYTREFIDHPALLAYMVKLRQTMDQQTKDMPARFAHKVKLPMPFSGDLGDGIWIDPMRAFYPAADVFKMTDLERAQYGGGDTTDPNTAFTDLFGIHKPYQLAWALLTGHPDELQNTLASLPAARLLRGATSFLTPGGVGLDTQYDKFYYERALKELVAEGKLTADQAKVALLQQKGPEWDMARQRAGIENYGLKELPAALGFRGTAFTAGEQKYLDAQQAKETLLNNAVRQLRGNPNMTPDQRYAFLSSKGYYKSQEYQDFQKQYPELETSSFIGKGYDANGNALPADQAQAARLRDYLTSKILDGYYNAPTLQKKLIAAQLGQTFSDLVLKKPSDGTARDYSKIPMNTLLGWANAIGEKIPNTPGYIQPQPEPFHVNFPTASQNERYQKFNDQIANGVGWEQEVAWGKQYAALKQSDPAAAKAWLNTPDGKQAIEIWKFKSDFFKQNPDIQKLLEQAGLMETQTQSAMGSQNPKGDAFVQALTAIGYESYDAYKAESDAYKQAGPVGSQARRTYLAQHPMLLRAWNAASAIYGDSNYTKTSSSSYTPRTTVVYKNAYQPRSGKARTHFLGHFSSKAYWAASKANYGPKRKPQPSLPGARMTAGIGG